MTALINFIGLLNRLIAKLILFVFLRCVFICECLFVWVLRHLDDGKKWGIFKK